VRQSGPEVTVTALSDADHSGRCELGAAIEAVGDWRKAADLRRIRSELSFAHFVAKRGECVSGFIEGHFEAEYDDRLSISAPAPQGWIHEILVFPHRRRTGVGSALVRRFAQEAAERGCSHLACLVDQRGGIEARMNFFNAVGMLPLVPNDPTDAVGARISWILQSTEPSTR
jgi:GNAT superfamily N-acetyltransferase